MELSKLYQMDDENIELHIFNNKVIFKFNNIIFMSKLINGNFPDTSKLIPSEFEIIVESSLNDYYNAIDRASLLTSEEEKNIINLSLEQKKMKISSNIPEIGNVEENLIVKNKKGEKINISFSSKYMMDAIKSFESEEIEILFNGDIKPIILKDPNNEDLIQLIVPIRTY